MRALLLLFLGSSCLCWKPRSPVMACWPSAVMMSMLLGSMMLIKTDAAVFANFLGVIMPVIGLAACCRFSMVEWE